MNNYPNTYKIPSPEKSEEKETYTPPSVPKPSLISPIIFAAIFYLAGTFFPFPFGILFLIPAAILSAKAFSVRYTLLPILSVLPSLLLPLFIGSELYAIYPLCAFLCALAAFLAVKSGGNKTTAVIASSCVIILILAVFFLSFVYFRYGGISPDDFRELINEWRDAFRDFIDLYITTLDTEIAKLPDSPQKEYNLKLMENMKQTFADTDGILDAFLYIAPSLVISFANVISYFLVLIYFYLIREGSGHKITVAKSKAALTVSIPGVILFALGYLGLMLSIFIPYAAVLGLNFVIIFTPALCIVGARSILDPEARQRNKILLVATVVMVFINPILALLLLGFMGANTILTSAMINFIKNRLQ